MSICIWSALVVPVEETRTLVWSMDLSGARDTVDELGGGCGLCSASMVVAFIDRREDGGKDGCDQEEDRNKKKVG